MELQNDPGRADLEQEALRWLTKLTSGSATEEDRTAFLQWRHRHPEHEAAFANALNVWRGVGLAAQPAMLPQPSRGHTRRNFIKAGALAAGVAAVSIGGAKLGFWPGISGILADHATATGEQKHVEIDSNISVDLNTRSAFSAEVGKAASGVKLSEGEAIFTVRAGAESFHVSAGPSVIALERCTVAVRHDGNDVRITCIEGGVDILQPAKLRLKPSEQMTCSAGHVGTITRVNAEAVTSWRRGELLFRDEPLENVVSEINRYRKGMVVIASRGAAERRVTGLFHLNRLDEALEHIQSALNIPMRQLSPYFVVLG